MSARLTAPQRRMWLALFFLFGLPGVVLSSWVTRTPAFRETIAATIAEMGFVLFGISVGSIVGILLSTLLAARLGPRRAVALSSSSILLGCAALAAAAATASAPVAFVGLVLFGWGMGASEVGINTGGTRLEAETGRPLLSSLHAGFSIGTVVGASLGFAADGVGVPIAVHLGAVLAACAVPAVLAVRELPSDRLEIARAAAPASDRRRGPDRRVILIGVVVFALALAEGSANDWLPLIMVDGHGLSSEAGALAFLAFAGAMSIGRLVAPAVITRFGRVAVLRCCAGLAAFGLLLVIAAPHPVVAAAASVLWGLGASVGFPISISAAADGAAQPDRRVAQIVTTGYLAFLVGPPALGLLGDEVGLRAAMVVVLVLAATAGVLAGAVGRPRESLQHAARR